MAEMGNDSSGKKPPARYSLHPTHTDANPHFKWYGVHTLQTQGMTKERMISKSFITNNDESNSWFIVPKPNPMARLRLFCFPYAGGGASIFHAWANTLPSDIETVGIQMPGIESRILEPPIESISLVVQTLLSEIYSKCDKSFVFFGHSLGALICFELTRHLKRRYGLQPLHMFVAGIHAPHILNRKSPIHDLPETDFLEMLQGRYSGIPEEILRNPDMLQLVLPGLKASLKMYECYRYQEDDPLDCGITAFGGSQDKNTLREDLEAWRLQTKRSFTLHMFPGSHFFINSEQKQFLRTLSSELTEIVSHLR